MLLTKKEKLMLSKDLKLEDADIEGVLSIIAHILSDIAGNYGGTGKLYNALENVEDAIYKITNCHCDHIKEIRAE